MNDWWIERPGNSARENRKIRLKNKIAHTLQNTLHGHNWHGGCCADCEELVEELANLLVPNRRELW